MERLKQLVAGMLDELGPRVVVLVNPVAKTHQALAARFVFGRRNEPVAAVQRDMTGRAAQGRNVDPGFAFGPFNDGEGVNCTVDFKFG